MRDSDSTSDPVYLLRQIQHACDVALQRAREGKRIHKSATGIIVLALRLEELVKERKR